MVTGVMYKHDVARECGVAPGAVGDHTTTEEHYILFEHQRECIAIAYAMASLSNLYFFVFAGCLHSVFCV